MAKKSVKRFVKLVLVKCSVGLGFDINWACAVRRGGGGMWKKPISGHTLLLKITPSTTKTWKVSLTVE